MQRRDFIKLLGQAGTSLVAYTACSTYMEQALAGSSSTIDELLAASGECQHHSLADIEHIVFLMQENRSFDHYFGTLRGVRGFGDPRPQKLINGKTVWEQSTDAKPYRVPKKVGYETPILSETIAPDNVGSVYLQDPPHNFSDGLMAWNFGAMDSWVEEKHLITMAHYVEKDIPLYFKLAKSFTLCDAYFCSHNGGTDTNRAYFFTGACMGKTGNNYFSFSTELHEWLTFPERLEGLGVSWKFYQDGLTWTMDPFTGNYGDNTLDHFERYKDTTSPLYEKNQVVNSVLRTKADELSQFETDIASGQLPAVSWIVAPEAFSEHPHFPPHFGEYYVHEILRAFAANKEVWKKTLFIITYDENGGFFDHVLPPVPAVGMLGGKISAGIGFDTVGTINSEVSIDKMTFDGEVSEVPIGMGHRVPTLVISPWSVGGRVCSETFDHTSPIRLLEKWMVARGLVTTDNAAFPNISMWRREIAGDMTSTLDFKTPTAAGLDSIVSASEPARIISETDKDEVPRFTFWAPAGYYPQPDDITADPDSAKPVASKQDAQRCEILPLNYDFTVLPAADATGITLKFSNKGPLGVAFTVIPYESAAKPHFYSLEKAAQPTKPIIELTDRYEISSPSGDYSYAIHGPNGSFHEFKGNVRDPLQQLTAEIADVKSKADAATIEFTFGKWNPNGKLTMVNAYTGETKAIGDGTTTVETATADGWYDVAFFDSGTYLRRYAGHLENGKIGKSDPAIGLQYDEKERVYRPLVA